VATDFEAEGLLEGLDGDAREARLELLRALENDGFELGELREAAAQGRLALLPAERALAPPGPRYTFDDLARESGLDEDFLAALIRALGLPSPVDGEATYMDYDLEAARTVTTFRDAGIPDEGILEITRVLGHSLSQFVAANRGVVGQAFLRPGDNEYDVAMRWAEAARTLNPALEEVVAYMLRAHQVAQLRQDVLDIAGMAAGNLPGAAQVSVCFADLAGFTPLGEQVPADELGGIAGRLTALATDIASPPIRLVKMIGDAAMLVSGEPEPLLRAALGLVELADAEGEDFPQLRAGIATGEAIQRGGDWFGRPVNLASRITDRARPGSVVVTGDFRAAVGDDGFQWSRLGGRRKLKGIAGDVELYRVRYADDVNAPKPQT
jgi:adenylate cyclase